MKLIGQLEELLGQLEQGNPARETVPKEVACLREHQSGMDYRSARQRKEPLDSGAVEATCAQYQYRFKRTGQFCSPAGDEALLWSGHILAQRTLAPAVPAHRSQQCVQKLKCTDELLAGIASVYEFTKLPQHAYHVTLSHNSKGCVRPNTPPRMNLFDMERFAEILFEKFNIPKVSRSTVVRS